MAIESTSKVDDEQWLAYWILYSFLTLMEMLLQPLLEWLVNLFFSNCKKNWLIHVKYEKLLGWLIRIPIWYDLKLAFVAWLVLPQFRGAAFIYEKFVREKVIKRYGGQHLQKPPKDKAKFVNFVATKKVMFVCIYMSVHMRLMENLCCRESKKLISEG